MLNGKVIVDTVLVYVYFCLGDFEFNKHCLLFPL